MKEIPVTDLMSQEVELVAPDTPLREVIQRMDGNRHSCMLIGEDGILRGIITERDLVQFLGQVIEQPELVTRCASSIMSTPPHTVRQEQSLFDALVISRAENIRHLPVVNARQQLVGLLTQTNLTHAHFHVIERQRRIIDQAIDDRTQELRLANQELQSLSMEDALLEIGNRRAMEVDMDHTHSLAARYQRPYTVVLLDVDFFKLYNDYYGHLAGDRALQSVTRVVQAAVRQSDRLYRYGGEELLLVLPDTPASGGATLAKRLIEDVCQAGIPHCKSPYGVVTMSGGLADCRTSATASSMGWREIVCRADQSLYAAKGSGRNRVA